MSTPQSQHSEIIEALKELYILLATLGAFPELDGQEEDTVLIPPHAPGSINAAAASEAGFAPEAVEFMSMLPYLAVARESCGSFEILPSTKPLTFHGEDLDAGHFEDLRDLDYNGGVMPATALRLTRINIYGAEWIYDVETCLLTAWEPFDDPTESENYLGVPAQPPRQVLKPVIDKYQHLDYIVRLDGYVDFSSPLFSESGGRPPKDWGPEDARVWEAQYAVWQAVRGIKDIYIDCGWDVDRPVMDQSKFKRDDFLRKRAEYWRDVVEPLIEEEAEVGRQRAGN
ncbi:hypothetical protein BJ166DRAFT_146092 [Pestalotiopsis sp. NC0098]|nr:hypothetical protein BJ166DRAFT_146092 [Pestalotiopsis sp. NC0098]